MINDFCIIITAVSATFQHWGMPGCAGLNVVMPSIYTASQKTSTFLFVKYLCQKLTDFNDFGVLNPDKI